ncbi:lecithin retinol acyltransferase family protein [Treponema sp. R80B11-R83G3]
MNISSKFQPPSKGDVVWAFRFPYFHCGIYEDENSVIHFASTENASKSKETAIICKTSLEKFADGFPVFVVEFPNEKCFPPNEVITRAHSRLNDTGYNLPLNNCDHFATWCKTGKHNSIQIDFIKEMVIAICKALDNSGNKKTEFAKYVEIAIKIYEIAEIFASLEIKNKL